MKESLALLPHAQMKYKPVLAASSSKNTTLEVFSTATSPTSPQGDGLPLTTTGSTEDSQKGALVSCASPHAGKGCSRQKGHYH